MFRSLLLTERPYAYAYNYLKDNLTTFEELLESPDVELRIAAGEALIILVRGLNLKMISLKVPFS
jgi:hypothetical protein